MSIRMDRAASGRGMLLVGLAAVQWGTAGVVSKGLIEAGAMSPLTIGFYRLALAAPLLLAMAVRLQGRAAFAIARRDWGRILLIGGMQAAYQGLYLAALANVGVTLATLLALCSAPVLVAVLAVLLLGEALTRRMVLAVLLAVAGTGLLVGFPDPAVMQRPGFAAGVLMAIGAALAYAVFAIASRSLAARYHPFQLVAFGLWAGAMMLLPAAMAQGVAVEGGAEAWAALGYIVVASTAAAYALFLHGLRTTPATVSGVLVLLEPLTAAGLAWLAFGERLGPLGALGGGLLLVAVWLLTRRRER